MYLQKYDCSPTLYTPYSLTPTFYTIYKCIYKNTSVILIEL